MSEKAEPVPDVTYDANGNLEYRGASLDGGMHGPLEFLRSDGSLMRAGSFDRGGQIGRRPTFDRAECMVRETESG